MKHTVEMEGQGMVILQKALANRESYKPLLLMADEDEAILNQYINDGELYEMRIADDIVGVALFIPIDEQTIELKNIALRQTYRGQGIAKEMILQAETLFKGAGYTRMTVGTANCSINNIALYQKMGFRLFDVKRGFFDAYSKTIVEHGIEAHDLWMFEKAL